MFNYPLCSFVAIYGNNTTHTVHYIRKRMVGDKATHYMTFSSWRTGTLDKWVMNINRNTECDSYYVVFLKKWQTFTNTEVVNAITLNSLFVPSMQWSKVSLGGWKALFQYIVNTDGYVSALICYVQFLRGTSSGTEWKVKRPYDKVIHHKLCHKSSPPEVGKAVYWLQGWGVELQIW